MKMSERRITGLLLALIVAVQLSFGLPRLAKYSAVDEHLWTYERIPQFWSAVEQLRFKKTNINDKPGITVALISGFGMLAVDPKPYDSLRTEPKTPVEVALIEKINIVFRLPIYLFTLCMLPVFYFLLKKLFGPSIALFATAITYLSPIILGISLIINPDSLLWIFLPLTILSFLVFQKSKHGGYAYLCGLFLGLALLTKYVTAILYVYLPLLIFLEAIFLSDTFDVPGYFKRSLLGYGKVIAISLITVAVLYPATWVRPELILETTFLSHPFEPIWKPFALLLIAFSIDVFLFKSSVSARIVKVLAPYRKMIPSIVFGIALVGILFTLINTYTGMKFYDFQSMLASAMIKSGVDFFSTIALQGISTGLFVLIFSIPPIVLLLLFFALVSGIWGIWRKTFHEESSLISYLLLFMLLYYAASAMNSVQATVRYQIALYPLAAIIAATGLHQLLQKIRITRVLPHWVASVFLIGLLSLSLFLIRPYYFAYASELLPHRYVLNMKDMGDGSFQAAKFLNAQPGAERLHIWSDKVAVCEYFIGNCNVSLKPKNLIGTYFDYFVISNGLEPKSRYFISIRNNTLPEFLRLRDLYSSNDFDGYTIVIDGRSDNFVKIIKNATPPNQ